MTNFEKGDYLAIEIGGFDNRIIYCILNEVLDYIDGKPNRLVGYVYIYDNTLLPIGKDIIKNIEIDGNDKVRKCRYDEFNAINNILFRNGFMWNPDRNNLIPVKGHNMLNAYTIKAYIKESRYISDDRLKLLLEDLDGEFGTESLEISIVEKGATGIICPKTLLQANVHCTIKFELKGYDLTDIYRAIEELKKHGIELLYLKIENK